MKSQHITAKARTPLTAMIGAIAVPMHEDVYVKRQKTFSQNTRERNM